MIVSFSSIFSDLIAPFQIRDTEYEYTSVGNKIVTLYSHEHGECASDLIPSKVYLRPCVPVDASIVDGET